MQVVASFEELQQQVAEIRSLKQGFVTNFFPDPAKNSLWVEKGDCFTERVNNTLFIIRKSPAFWNVFYCSTALESLGADLEVFHNQNAGETLMYDLVGREIQCKPLVDLFKAKGCTEAASLVRMTRLTAPAEYKPDASVRYATEKDLPSISEQLHLFFDERTEQIPYDEELKDYAERRHVLVCEENGVKAGFLVFELNATTLYLRYWFTHPDFRDRRVGSRLLRRFFEEGKDTKRQLLWVIRTNGNALVRYRHYGFVEENMFDYVMKYKNNQIKQ